MIRRFAVFSVLCFFSSVLLGQVILSERSTILDTVKVVGEKQDYLSLQRNGVKLDMKMMDMMPNILGNSDPIHYLQYLPNVQMTNEYDAGLYIQGCDNGHNMVSIEGVPIYNPGHLLGIFSTFNTSHYKSVQVNSNPVSSSSPNRIGGEVDMKLHDDVLNAIHGKVSVGPISSQGTIRMPLSKSSALAVSGRWSYLNLLYSRWLDVDGSKFKYNFSDYNVSYLHKINAKNTLCIDGYMGYDKANVDDSYYGLALSLEWGNRMISAHLKTNFSGSTTIHQKIFFSNYENSLKFVSDYIKMSVPSSISTYGYKVNMKSRRVEFGIDALLHNIELQSPAISNYYQDSSLKSIQRSQEISAYVDYTVPWKSFLFQMGIHGNYFHLNNYGRMVSADPSVSITFESTTNWYIKLTGYQRHQFLAQTGISSIGLPTEFWLSLTKPQIVRGICMRWRKFIDNRFSLSIEGFYKKLYNQIEFVGDLLDYKETNYTPNNYLYPSQGENYGFSINISKRTGKIVGWANYTYTHARRSADHPMLNHDYPSSHERPHELDIVATCRFNRWNFGVTFVYASGTSFTAPSAFYYNNGNIVSQFGEYNGKRLPGYSRLDLSANFFIKQTKGGSMGVNFSLYNAFNTGNPLLYRLKIYGNEYGYKRLTFVFQAMPSISFFSTF